MATTTQRATLRTFHGPTMAHALAEVKKGLGPDAVILHTRTYRVGGVMGVGGRDMVEITASTDAGGVRARRIRPRAEGGYDAGLAMGFERAGDAVTSDAGFVPTPPWFQPAGRAVPPAMGRTAAAGPARAAGQQVEAKPTVEGVLGAVPGAVGGPVGLVAPAPRGKSAAEIEATPPRRVVAAAPSAGIAAPSPLVTTPRVGGPDAPSRLTPTRVEPAPTTPRAPAALAEERAASRRRGGLVRQAARRAEARAGRAVESEAPSVGTGPVFDLYMQLLESQTSTEVADELAGAVRDELTAAELADPGVAREAMLRHLARKIAVVRDNQPPTRTATGRPSVVALVGPTGVGKTTTVAKLAATYKLRYGRKVGLVTADTYRIAAVEQLRTYADIVGLPLKIALSPRDMAGAIESLDACDVVLVDTAGRSQHDAARLGELGEFLEAARPDTSHLVLSLAAAESVIFAAAERFGVLRPQRLILSKLDEAVDFGVIANIARRVGLPISHVTTGQEVPDHIEPASADRLARLVLDGRAAWKVLSGDK